MSLMILIFNIAILFLEIVLVVLRYFEGAS